KIEIRPLRDDPDEPLDVNALPPDIEVPHPCVTMRWLDPCCQDSNRGGFAGAIWTEQPEDLSRPDLECEAIKRDDLVGRLWLALARPCRAEAHAAHLAADGRRRCVYLAKKLSAYADRHRSVIRRSYSEVM